MLNIKDLCVMLLQKMDEDMIFIQSFPTTKNMMSNYKCKTKYLDEHVIRKIQSTSTPLPPPKRYVRKNRPTHRNQTLFSDDRQHSIVAPRPSSSRVDEHMNSLIQLNSRRLLREHHIQIDSPEDLLEGVEGEPGQLRLDQVGAVLHDGLQLEVAVAALPPRDQVEHVGAVGGLPVLPALGAGEGDAEHVE